MKIKHDCIIVANGAFPGDDALKKLIREASVVIACDGAVNKLSAENITPHFIVGDLDSLSHEMRVKHADILHHNPDQETNDLTKAVNFAKQKGFSNPIIIGATGLREDHTLGNISLLTQYADLFDNICMVSDFGIFYPITETTTFECAPQQQVSLFSIFPFGTISTHGLKYPIRKRNLPVWWEGTLNETTGSSFTIEMEGKGYVLVYLCHSSLFDRNY